MNEQYHHQISDLPDFIVELILGYLDQPSIKSLSLTCYRLLCCVENIHNTIPRLHIFAIKSVHQRQKAMRIIPEAYPGSYLIGDGEQQHQSKREVITLCCSPASLPTYSEVRKAHWRYGLLFRKGYGMNFWLCPHSGIGWQQAYRLARQTPGPLSSVIDTVPTICPFPKCSLWARHALIKTQTVPVTFELCSVIRIYRCRCTSYADIRNRLRNKNFVQQLKKATAKLEFQICSHLFLSHHKVFAEFDFKDICLLRGSDSHLDEKDLWRLRNALDCNKCLYCQGLRTYTTWGFIARYIEDSGDWWLDIEMVLCRPLMDEGITKIFDSPHWVHHITGPINTMLSVGYWYDWAEVVAEDGFDWRLPLPPGFLRAPGRGLLDFPLKEMTHRRRRVEPFNEDLMSEMMGITDCETQ